MVIFSAAKTAYDTAVDQRQHCNRRQGWQRWSGGGAVTTYNSGLLFTLGDDAAGIKAQSIGGGGGNGGYGKINAGGYNSASGPSVTATVAIGGSGGSGGDSGNVSVYNYTNSILPPVGTTCLRESHRTTTAPEPSLSVRIRFACTHGIFVRA